MKKTLLILGTIVIVTIFLSVGVYGNSSTQIYNTVKNTTEASRVQTMAQNTTVEAQENQLKNQITNTVQSRVYSTTNEGTTVRIYDLTQKASIDEKRTFIADKLATLKDNKEKLKTIRDQIKSNITELTTLRKTLKDQLKALVQEIETYKGKTDLTDAEYTKVQDLLNKIKQVLAALKASSQELNTSLEQYNQDKTTDKIDTFTNVVKVQEKRMTILSNAIDLLK